MIQLSVKIHFQMLPELKLFPPPCASPLAAGEEPGAGLSVPGAVGVPGQAALSAAPAVELTPVEAQLDDAELTGHVELLLWRRRRWKRSCWTDVVYHETLLNREQKHLLSWLTVPFSGWESESAGDKEQMSVTLLCLTCLITDYLWCPSHCHGVTEGQLMWEGCHQVLKL